MDPAMLLCSICPQQRDFSDISHLLTHIGSKGHLAHLHKLQVKSHQEVAAGVQLASYNQWYQQHGLGSLLSERLQQKEMKQSGKNSTVAVKRERMVKDERPIGAGSLPASSTQQVESARAYPQLKAGKRERLEDDAVGSDLDYNPRDRNRQPKKSAYCTPVKSYPSLTSSPRFGDYSPEIDPTLASTPTRKSAKLKGKIWPGMALFDAATPDEQRKRNQKKDGSVLRRMERLSRLVDPQETVHSAEFTMQKHRHIDELDDVSSLIEGETPITKPKPRPRRKALARVSSNVPRLVSKRKPRAVHARHQRRVGNKNGLPNIARIPSSSADARYGLQSGFFPTADENLEFQLAVGNLPVRKRTGNFTIFNDNESPAGNLSRHSAYAPVQSLGQSYTMTQPKLSYPNAPWLQPQNQNPIYLGNQYQAYRPIYTTCQPLQDIGLPKENVIPMTGRVVNSGYQTANPIAWKSPQATHESHSSETSFGSFSGYFATASGLPDPFGYARNPLLDALAHFNAEGSSSPAKQGPLPDRSAEEIADPPKQDNESTHDSNETISEPQPQEQPADVTAEA